MIALCGSFHCDSTVADEPARLRVLTYNIHAGRGLDGKLDIERIAKSINDAKPDLVALQELDRRTRRSDGRDLLAELGELTGMASAFGKAIDFQDGEYGVGVLSKFEIVHSKTYRLPTSKGREQRVALEVKVLPEGLPRSVFVCTHFDHSADATDRLAQAKRVVELFSKGPSAAIVAGDLNATPMDEPIALMKEHWSLADEQATPTYSSESPNKKIDYLLYEKAIWRVSSANVLRDATGSDHLPLLAELVVRGQSAPAAESAGSDSVPKKGLNDNFLKPGLNIDEWIGRFEVESREVFAARSAVLAAIGLKPGMKVADVGAGTGLYTRAFAKAVGDTGWVFAVDISPRFLQHINEQADKEEIENVTTVLGGANNIRLPQDSVDVV